jgi:hypothetical protein
MEAASAPEASPACGCTAHISGARAAIMRSDATSISDTCILCTGTPFIATSCGTMRQGQSAIQAGGTHRCPMAADRRAMAAIGIARPAMPEVRSAVPANGTRRRALAESRQGPTVGGTRYRASARDRRERICRHTSRRPPFSPAPLSPRIRARSAGSSNESAELPCRPTLAGVALGHGRS